MSYSLMRNIVIFIIGVFLLVAAADKSVRAASDSHDLIGSEHGLIINVEQHKGCNLP